MRGGDLGEKSLPSRCDGTSTLQVDRTLNTSLSINENRSKFADDGFERDEKAPSA
jgi:hypothetical protein